MNMEITAEIEQHLRAFKAAVRDAALANEQTSTHDQKARERLNAIARDTWNAINNYAPVIDANVSRFARFKTKLPDSSYLRKKTGKNKGEFYNDAFKQYVNWGRAMVEAQRLHDDNLRVFAKPKRPGDDEGRLEGGNPKRRK